MQLISKAHVHSSTTTTIWISYYFLQVFVPLFLFFPSNLWMHSGPHLLVRLHFDFFFSRPTPFRICSSSATDLWSGLPPTFPAYLPPIPWKLCALVSNKYFWPAAAQLCSQSLHLGLRSLHPLWHSRRGRRREALYARVQSHGAISSGGVYKAATICTQGCTSSLLSHFPLAPSHCPLTRDAADISGRLVNSRSDSGWEGLGGWRRAVWINKSWGRFERMWNWSHLLMKPVLIRCRVAIRGEKRMGPLFSGSPNNVEINSVKSSGSLARSWCLTLNMPPPPQGKKNPPSTG